jgi:CRISPR-associated protein Csx10
MNVLTYRIELLEPALITAVEGDPNSAISLDYVTGSVLRGALIQKYMQHHPGVKAADLLQDTGAQTLFFSGAARFLNGYLLKDNVRTLPTPLAWLQPKDELHTVYDFAVKAVTDKSGRKWGGFGQPFVVMQSDQIKGCQPDRQIAIHTQRDRDYGRPTKESGAVYRYDALAAGQTFEAAIVGDDRVDLKDVISLLSGEVYIGGSRNGGYGRVKVMFDAKTAVMVGGWREVGTPSLSASVNNQLIITLLSDALIRDENGQFSTDYWALENCLRKTMAAPGATFKEAFVRGRVVGGFNRKTNLPLPQALAVQAGSVVVFDVSQCDAAQLRTLTERLGELEQAGIGERRAEGFGRVGINWHTRETWKVFQPPRDAPGGPQDNPPRVAVTEATSKALAEAMTQRLLRSRLDEAVIAAANKLQVEHAPQRAQLTRLRSILADELMKPEPGLKRLTDFMSQVEKRSAARKQFEAARIGEERTRLLIWLKESEAKIADRAQLLTKDLPASRVGTVTAEVSDALRAEYVLRLIDTVLAHAAKTQQQKEGK